MSDTVTIEYNVSTFRVGSKETGSIEIDKEEWNEMSAECRDEVIFEQVLQLIEWDYEETN